MLPVLPISAWAGTLEDGKIQLQDGDVEGGVETLNALAESADAATQYEIGVALINFSAADGVRWMETAADRGNAEAQRDVGMLYAFGNGVPKDLPKAFLWLYVAEKGSKDAAIREDIHHTLKQVYAEMTKRERYNAEQLVRYWQPKP